MAAAKYWKTLAVIKCPIVPRGAIAHIHSGLLIMLRLQVALLQLGQRCVEQLSTNGRRHGWMSGGVHSRYDEGDDRLHTAKPEK
jgi:hypothetical protein